VNILALCWWLGSWVGAERQEDGGKHGRKISRIGWLKGETSVVDFE